MTTVSKQLSCRDLGMDCDYVIKGENDEEVIKGAMEHATEVHPEMLATITTSEQMEQMQSLVVSKIVDASVSE